METVEALIAFGLKAVGFVAEDTPTVNMRRKVSFLLNEMKGKTEIVLE